MNEPMRPKRGIIHALIRRNVMIFEMSLHGFTYREISAMMDVKYGYCANAVRGIYRLLTDAERLHKPLPFMDEFSAENLRKDKEFWFTELDEYKKEIDLKP